ncbi:MAG: hypothetical protein HUU50_00160 [Candidatus Brocadiae bacterium]|nr:hypothetical protein [Candidatus Brocadiia bacterium]
MSWHASVYAKIIMDWQDLWKESPYSRKGFPSIEYRKKWIDFFHGMDTMNHQTEAAEKEEISDKIITQGLSLGVVKIKEEDKEYTEYTEETRKKILSTLPDGQGKDKIFFLYWGLAYLKWITLHPEQNRLEIQNPSDYWNFLFSGGIHSPANYIMGYMVPELFKLDFQSKSKEYIELASTWLQIAWQFLLPFWKEYFVDQSPEHLLDHFWQNCIHIDQCSLTNPWIWFFFSNSIPDTNNSREKYLEYFGIAIAEKNILIPLRGKHLYDPLLLYILETKTAKNVLFEKKKHISLFFYNLKRFLFYIPFFLRKSCKNIWHFLKECLIWNVKSFFMLVGDTASGKTSLMAVASSWKAHYETLQEHNIAPEFGNIYEIDTISENEDLKAYLQGCFNSIDQSKLQKAPGTDDRMDLQFDLTYKWGFLKKKIELRTQDYPGIISILREKNERMEESQKFFNLLNQTNIILFLLPAEVFPDLIPFQSKKQIQNYAKRLRNLEEDILGSLQSISDELMKMKGKKRFCLLITKSDTIPGFSNHVSNMRCLYRKNMSPQFYYQLINGHYVWNDSMPKLIDRLIARYKNHKHPCYNLEWARSIEIMLTTLQMHLSILWSRAEVEIFFVSALGKTERKEHRDEMTGESSIDYVPKKPIEPYGVYPLFQWMIEKSL